MPDETLPIKTLVEETLPDETLPDETLSKETAGRNWQTNIAGRDLAKQEFTKNSRMKLRNLIPMRRN